MTRDEALQKVRDALRGGLVSYDAAEELRVRMHLPKPLSNCRDEDLTEYVNALLPQDQALIDDLIKFGRPR